MSTQTEQLARRWRQDMLLAAGTKTRLPRGRFTAVILVVFLVFALLVSLTVLIE